MTSMRPKEGDVQYVQEYHEQHENQCPSSSNTSGDNFFSGRNQIAVSQRLTDTPCVSPGVSKCSQNDGQACRSDLDSASPSPSSFVDEDRCHSSFSEDETDLVSFSSPGAMETNKVILRGSVHSQIKDNRETCIKEHSVNVPDAASEPKARPGFHPYLAQNYIKFHGRPGERDAKPVDRRLGPGLEIPSQDSGMNRLSGPASTHAICGLNRSISERYLAKGKDYTYEGTSAVGTDSVDQSVELPSEKNPQWALISEDRQAGSATVGTYINERLSSWRSAHKKQGVETTGTGPDIDLGDPRCTSQHHPGVKTGQSHTFEVGMSTLSLMLFM